MEVLIVIVNFSIDGITVEPEYEHWKLSKNGCTMRCDSGELNTAIPEFKNWVEEQRQAAISQAVIFMQKRRKRK